MVWRKRSLASVQVNKEARRFSSSRQVEAQKAIQVRAHLVVQERPAQITTSTYTESVLDVLYMNGKEIL